MIMTLMMVVLMIAQLQLPTSPQRCFPTTTTMIIMIVMLMIPTSSQPPHLPREALIEELKRLNLAATQELDAIRRQVCVCGGGVLSFRV